MKAWLKDQKNWRWTFRQFKSRSGEFYIRAGWQLDQRARIIMVGFHIKTRNRYLLIGVYKPVRQR